MKNKESQLISAIHFIYENIDVPFVLRDVAKAAKISESGLKRLFNELLDQSPGSFIRRLRMELAFKSLQSKKQSIVETALEIGYQDHASFSRSFRHAFGFSPSLAKTKLNVMGELDYIELDEPEIINMNEIHLQVVTEKGSYFEAAPKAWENLRHHLVNENLVDGFLGMYVGIGLDNPHQGEVNHDQVSFSAGVSCILHDLNISKRTLPSGKYARFHFYGKLNKLGLAYHYILGQWVNKNNVKILNKELIYQVFDTYPSSENNHTVLICLYLEE